MPSETVMDDGLARANTNVNTHSGADANNDTLSVEGLLGRRQTPTEWINEQMSSLPSLTLQSDHQLTARYISHLESIRWQLEQAALRQVVAFETAIRQYCARLAQAHVNLRQLRSVHERDQTVETQLEKADALAAQLRDILGGERLERVRELLGKKSTLKKLVQEATWQARWLEQVAAMEAALTTNDADTAEETLSRLDGLLLERWPEDVKRATQVDDLRHRLVELIKNS